MNNREHSYGVTTTHGNPIETPYHLVKTLLRGFIVVFVGFNQGLGEMVSIHHVFSGKWRGLTRTPTKHRWNADGSLLKPGKNRESTTSKNKNPEGAPIEPLKILARTT